MTRLRHRFDDCGAVTLCAIDALLCFAAPNGTPATTESVLTEDWGAQMARATQLAEAAEAAGQVPAEYLDKGGDDAGEDEGEETPAAAKPEAKPGKKPEAKPEAKAEGDEDKNKGAVTPTERANFREEKRKWREKRDADVAQFRKELGEAKSKYGKLEDAQALLDAGDPVGAVEKLTGQKWNDIQKVAVKRAQGADPRVDKLERELEAEREARAKAESDRAEREQKEKYSAAKREWINGLHSELGDGEDEIAELAKTEPGFLEDVFALQEKEYDEDTGETLTHREAAEQVIGNWRALYESLAKVFGGQPASKAENSGNGVAHRKGSTSAKPGAKAPKTLSQRKAAEASPPEPAEFDESRWLKKFSKRMRESEPE